MHDFTARAVDVIRSIPAGKVMTYGQIAACAGSPRGARQIVRILHAMSGKHDLPWHRVINSKGEIGLREPYYRELQMQGLEDEGIELSPGGRVDLEKYRHEPLL
jgi:methylated-DNA-protein-cysteine methyltransferase-like protein